MYESLKRIHEKLQVWFAFGNKPPMKEDLTMKCYDKSGKLGLVKFSPSVLMSDLIRETGMSETQAEWVTKSVYYDLKELGITIDPELVQRHALLDMGGDYKRIWMRFIKEHKGRCFTRARDFP